MQLSDLWSLVVRAASFTDSASHLLHQSKPLKSAVGSWWPAFYANGFGGDFWRLPRFSLLDLALSFVVGALFWVILDIISLARLWWEQFVLRTKAHLARDQVHWRARQRVSTAVPQAGSSP